MLYTNNNRSSSTIPPYWLIKSFHSTIHMYFCPQKWRLKCHALARKMSIVHANATAADTFIPCWSIIPGWSTWIKFIMSWARPKEGVTPIVYVLRFVTTVRNDFQLWLLPFAKDLSWPLTSFHLFLLYFRALLYSRSFDHLLKMCDQKLPSPLTCRLTAVTDRSTEAIRVTPLETPPPYCHYDVQHNKII